MQHIQTSLAKEARIFIIKKMLEEMSKEEIIEQFFHLNAYKDYHDRLGNTLSTAVNHYNNSTKEFKKIDKDVIKISSGNSKLNFDSEEIEKPLLNE